VNNAPVILPRHGVEIALAQEALVLGLDQLVDGAGIPPVLGVEDTNCPGILHSPVHGFGFLIAADLFRHLWRGHGQRHENQ
jgi:hypothetical protein